MEPRELLVTVKGVKTRAREVGTRAGGWVEVEILEPLHEHSEGDRITVGPGEWELYETPGQRYRAPRAAPPRDRDALEGRTLQMPPCGCTVEGAGNLRDPVRIVFCVDHAAMLQPRPRVARLPRAALLVPDVQPPAGSRWLQPGEVAYRQARLAYNAIPAMLRGEELPAGDALTMGAAVEEAIERLRAIAQALAAGAGLVAEAPTGASPTMQEDEAFAALLERGAVRWCRARLLRGLALAAKQAILDEVLEELLPGVGGDVLELLLRALVATGWLRSPDDRLVP